MRLPPSAPSHRSLEGLTRLAATDNGVTTGNKTLSMLIDAIQAISGVTYKAVEIAPIDLMDGGQPGGNIRPGATTPLTFFFFPLRIDHSKLTLFLYGSAGMLYRADRLEFDPLSPAGSNTDAQSFVRDPVTGETTFALNPGTPQVSLRPHRKPELRSDLGRPFFFAWQD